MLIFVALFHRAICITDAEKVAEATGCLVHYIRKGIAMSCFVYGRCLAKGYGIDRDKQTALEYYAKVTIISLYYIYIYFIPTNNIYFSQTLK